MALTWCFFLSLATAFQGGVYQNGNDWSVRESSSDVPLAYGSFLDNIESTGWSILNIFTNDAADAPDASKWYAAGYFEGFTTCERIGQYYINFYWEIFGQDPVPEKIVDYMQKTDNYTVTMAALNAATDPYWNAVNLTMSRMNGLIDGYAASSCAANQPLSRLEFWLVSSDGDLFDLTEALNELPSNRVRRGRSGHRGIMSHQLSQVNNDGQTEIKSKIDIDGLNINTTGRKVPRCSVLIKLTENNDDLIFAHATWDDFTSLGPRVYKNFNFTVQGERYIDSFSSCAGFIASVDDWYVLNSGLVVTETSYSCYNRTLFNYLNPNSLLSWIRTMVANRLATTGKEWVDYFTRENSGTYNNQWMVIDTKLFKSGHVLQPNTLWIVEQMPGSCVSGDVSDVLQKQGYWASYNIPFFPQVYRETGYLAAYELLGNEYSFSQCPRAQIFARNQSNVQSLDDMKKMIQYNKWQTDPLSEGKGSNAVASRYDLDPVPEAAGALDSKVSSASILKDLSLTQHIICGPTHDDQPVFCWEGAFDVVPHKGQPRCYNFTWEILTPQYLPPPSSI